MGAIAIVNYTALHSSSRLVIIDRFANYRFIDGF